MVNGTLQVTCYSSNLGVGFIHALTVAGDPSMHNAVGSSSAWTVKFASATASSARARVAQDRANVKSKDVNMANELDRVF